MCSDEQEWIAFHPVYLNDNQRLVQSEGDVTAELRENLAHVLRYYGQPHCFDESGVLKVSEELAGDLDLRWNYTTKAHNPDWLSQHPDPANSTEVDEGTGYYLYPIVRPRPPGSDS